MIHIQTHTNLIEHKLTEIDTIGSFNLNY
jgi:hypothetical protein